MVWPIHLARLGRAMLSSFERHRSTGGKPRRAAQPRHGRQTRFERGFRVGRRGLVERGHALDGDPTSTSRLGPGTSFGVGHVEIVPERPIRRDNDRLFEPPEGETGPKDLKKEDHSEWSHSDRSEARFFARTGETGNRTKGPQERGSLGVVAEWRWYEENRTNVTKRTVRGTCEPGPWARRIPRLRGASVPLPISRASMRRESLADFGTPPRDGRTDARLGLGPGRASPLWAL